MGKLTIVSVLLVALIVSFYGTTIVPDGFSQPWKLRTVLSFVRIASKLVKIASLFGYEEIDVMRSVCEMSVSKKHQENDTLVHLLDTAIEGIPVRFYWPAGKSKKDMPGIIYFHGGGGTFGSVAMYSPITYELSKKTDTVVVSVEYRLAPEHIFPAGFHDCYMVTKYIIQNAQKYGVDANRIAVMGDSAGGNLAASVALRLRDTNILPSPKLQVLIYPGLQGTDFNTPSMQYNQHGPVLTKQSIAVFRNVYAFGHLKYLDMMLVNNHTSSKYKITVRNNAMNLKYIPDDVEKELHAPPDENSGNVTFWEKYQHILTNPYFSPIHAETFNNLPKTYISTCQYDVSRDDGFFYAGLLSNAGVDVTHEHLHACFHGWITFIDMLETAKDHFNRVTNFISKNL